MLCKNIKMRADVIEKDATRCLDREADEAVNLSVDKSINVEDENVAAKSLKFLVFCDRMKRLSPHCHPLKEQMKDQMVC